MINNLTVGTTVIANPGDTFTFIPPSSSVQYHFQLNVSDPSAIIGIWQNSASVGNGVARNQPGKNYVDHVCGAGNFVVTVTGVTEQYTMTVSANSWWHKVFGWGSSLPI